MTDWPASPFFDPSDRGAADDDVVRAFARNQPSAASPLFHAEGPVLMADRDMPTALRVGDRSFLVNREMPASLTRAKNLVEAVFVSEGLELYDEETLYGPAVGVQLVGLRFTSWDLWGADIESAFADLRMAAAGGEEDILFGGGDLPFASE